VKVVVEDERRATVPKLNDVGPELGGFIEPINKIVVGIERNSFAGLREHFRILPLARLARGA